MVGGDLGNVGDKSTDRTLETEHLTQTHTKPTHLQKQYNYSHTQHTYSQQHTNKHKDATEHPENKCINKISIQIEINHIKTQKHYIYRT